jgi:hypothetical protein
VLELFARKTMSTLFASFFDHILVSLVTASSSQFIQPVYTNQRLLTMPWHGSCDGQQAQLCRLHIPSSLQVQRCSH